MLLENYNPQTTVSCIGGTVIRGIACRHIQGTSVRISAITACCMETLLPSQGFCVCMPVKHHSHSERASSNFTGAMTAKPKYDFLELPRKKVLREEMLARGREGAAKTLPRCGTLVVREQGSTRI